MKDEATGELGVWLLDERAGTLWVEDGRLRYQVHYFDGLEASVDALNAMFTGANTGKILIRMSDSPI